MVKVGDDLKVERLVTCGERVGILDKLIKGLKYRSMRVAGRVIGDLVAEVIPCLPGRVIIVPLPTIGKHIRERGLDHTRIIAKRVARKRGFEMRMLLRRKSDFVQVGSSREKRLEQAKQAYFVNKDIDPEAIYILIDDVWTTGASMRAAYDELKSAGADKIILVAVSVSDKDVISENSLSGKGLMNENDLDVKDSMGRNSLDDK